MKLILNYIFPDSDHVVTTDVDPDSPYYEVWLWSVMDNNPNVNYFYTTATTDIFN